MSKYFSFMPLQRGLKAMLVALMSGWYVDQTGAGLTLFWLAGWYIQSKQVMPVFSLAIIIAVICFGLDKLGIYQPARDPVYIYAAVIIVVQLVSNSNFLIHRPIRRFFMAFAGIIGISWILASLIEWNSEVQSLSLDKNRFVKLQIEEKFKDLNIGLALSGGGYRAALMHAGVLDAAEKLGLRFSHISTVSGGSIIGSFYSVGGAPREFMKAVEQGQFSIKRQAFLLPNIANFSHRLNLQSKVLDLAYFKGMTIGALPLSQGPQLLICATDLLKGMAVGFSSKFALARDSLELAEKHHVINFFQSPSYHTTRYVTYANDFAARQSLAQLVAASGAFPLAFNSVELTLSYQEFDKERNELLLLADGGITDNTGIDMLLDAHRESTGTLPVFLSKSGLWPTLDDWELDFVLASDATALLEPLDGYIRLNDVSGFSRAIDIIYRNVRSRDPFPYIRMPKILLLNPEDNIFKYKTQSNNIYLDFKLMHFHLFDEYNNAYKDMVGYLPDQPLPKSLIEKFKLAEQQSQNMNMHELGQQHLKVGGSDAIIDFMLKHDIEDCLDTFLKTSTLQDRIDHNSASKLFRLGAYLLYLDWPLLETRLNELQRHREMAYKMWEKLMLSAENIENNKIDNPIFAPENSVLDMFDQSKRGNGFEPSFEDIKFEDKGRNPDYSVVLAATLAHRIAHAIIHAREPEKEYYAKRSLIDEIRGELKLDPVHEAEADELSQELLKKSSLPTNGAELLISKILQRYGEEGVHRDALARLKALKKTSTEIRQSVRQANSFR